MSNSFGSKLHNLRKLRQLTADQLSKASGVSRSYILLIESGKRQEVSIRITGMLARSLRVNPDYFKIENASLPMEILPDLPQEIMALILEADSMPYLKLTEKAKKNGLSPAALEKIIDILIESVGQEKAK
jgi:transcriptional regulator with XRE-family HTH domain